MKKLALILLILLSGAAASAQAVLQPLQQDARQPQKSNLQKRQAAATALSLPFFDDFAGATVVPDPERWQQNGGVYINSRYAFEPITKNVASFDGLDDFGQPYAPGSVAAGPSDTLTSLPIRLDDLSPADSVYLSFYWQSGGLGDVPDETAGNLVYLQLEFKDATGNWLPVWRQAGIGETSAFAQVFVGLKEATYFHDDFQFRFRSVGVRNGLADVWNVDYVELDKNRRKGRNTTRDIAISEGVSRLLKYYTAMPYRQFMKNKADELLAGEVQATVNNLGGLPGAISWRGYIRQLNRTAADTFLRAEALVPGGARQYIITGTPRVEKLNLPNAPFTLVHGMVLDTKEQNSLQRANDSTARKTDFADYFAYDDGTAEAGFSFLGTGNTQVAQRFDLNRPDQVKGFRVYFPHVNQDLSKTGLAFKVWADADGVPGEVLYQQSFPIQYSDSLNAFYEVALNQPVAVSGSFYVGWSQPGNLYVNIGFDRNEIAIGRRFLFTGYNDWQPDTVLAGAIMLRPVMAGEEALGIEEDLEAARIKVYPNPSSGEVYLEGAYQSLVLYDVTGKQVYRHTYNGSAAPLQLGKLAAGLYTLRITTKITTISKKIILTKP